MFPFTIQRSRFSRRLTGRRCLPGGLVLVISLLLAICFQQSFAIKRDPGRKGYPGAAQPVTLDPGSLSPSQGSGVVPGLIALTDFGNPEYAVTPALLYNPSEQALSGEADYFAKRIEVPVKGPFLVLGLLLMVPPVEADEIVPFPEILLVPETAQGLPDLDRPLVTRCDVAPSPGSSELMLDVSGDRVQMMGPGNLYLVVRFPPGGLSGETARILVDTDADAGAFPGTNLISTDGDGFIFFEQAAVTVRSSFYGLDNLPPPGLINDQLAMGLLIYTDTSNVPLYPPGVKEIRVTDQGTVRARLALYPFWADARPVGRDIERVRVYHTSLANGRDSVVGDFEPDTDRWIEITGIEEGKAYL
ncbi:MAG: hypothetical protein U9N45_01655, partial [Gemmatimonadota bacterium]|nr:hypothetical protein [Gemmatimonadota bacterium]